MEKVTPACTCYANYYGHVVFCPMHNAAWELYEALKAYNLANRMHNDAEAELFYRAECALSHAQEG